MRRLQTLKQLTLDLRHPRISWQTRISWQDFIHLLQLLPPSVKKLSLERLDLLNHKPPTHVLAEELVAQLVKFEEVDFDSFGCGCGRGCGCGCGWDDSTAILRRLTAVISSGEDSNLKVLSLPCFDILESRISYETLVEARKVLTVKIFDSDDSDEDDEDDEDYEGELYYEDDGDDGAVVEMMRSLLSKLTISDFCKS